LHNKPFSWLESSGADACDTRRARLYWEEYASRGAALAAAHPGRFRVFPSPAVFEDGAAQEALLRFAGVDAPRHVPGRRYNCAASCQGALPASAAAKQRTSRGE
jgi:hypothetical protein